MNITEFKDRLDQELKAWHLEVSEYNRLTKDIEN